MNRVQAFVELLVLVAVLGVGLVVWRADQHAREADRTQICLQRLQATALVAQLTPTENVDEEGRLRAVQVLGDRIDEC